MHAVAVPPVRLLVYVQHFLQPPTAMLVARLLLNLYLCKARSSFAVGTCVRVLCVYKGL